MPKGINLRLHTKPLPSKETIESYINYNPETGLFTNLKTGKVYSSTNHNNPYIRITIEKVLYKAHRLAYFLIYGIEHPIIDHIDGNTTNNAISNLRIASEKESAVNRRSKPNSSSKYRGVFRHRRSRMWEARIENRKKGKALGSFYTEEEAAYAYNIEALKAYGKFARLNCLTDHVIITPLPSRNSKSGFKGVYLNKNGTFFAKINKTEYLGTFDSAIEAALEYDLAAQRLGYHPCEYNFPPKALALNVLIQKYAGKSYRNKRGG